MMPASAPRPQVLAMILLPPISWAIFVRGMLYSWALRRVMASWSNFSASSNTSAPPGTMWDP